MSCCHLWKPFHLLTLFKTGADFTKNMNKISLVQLVYLKIHYDASHYINKIQQDATV